MDMENFFRVALGFKILFCLFGSRHGPGRDFSTAIKAVQLLVCTVTTGPN